MRKRPTIKDVAKKAGLSVSTVSLAINDSGYVSEETRKKVLQVVEELAYHPSRAARGLASRMSGNIGFILSVDHFSEAEPFYTKIFLGTEFEARRHKYYILLTTVGSVFKEHESVPRFLLERNVDGVIIAGKINPELIDYIDQLGLPMVLVDYELPKKKISSVLIDNRKGASLAVQHLIGLGHREIGFVGGDIHHPSLAERFLVYKETLMENGITPNANLIVANEKGTGIKNGFDAIHMMLSRGAKPTAIFAANDAMAIGCMQWVRQQGMRVPDDIAFIGFDDIEPSSHVEPRLTTIKVFKEEMGTIAVRKIIDAVKTKSQTITNTYVPVELVARESTLKQTSAREADNTAFASSM
ncbi:MAG TPA: LacI family DNA-binding transcriptional regulator [Bacteroidota bacterium]